MLCKHCATGCGEFSSSFALRWVRQASQETSSSGRVHRLHQYSSSVEAADIPTGLVDQILEYVRTAQNDHNQSKDVLNTGLGTVNETHPNQRARLLLSLAELNGDRNEWGQATTHSCTAWKLLAGETGSADAQLEAVSQHTRACLAAGQEDRASALLQQLEGAHSDALFRTSSTLQKLLALARGSSHQPRSPAQLDPVDVDSDSVDLALAIPIYYAGLDLLAQAQRCFERCAEAALPARELDTMAGRQRALLPPLSAAELYAGALSGSAQAALSIGNQDAAEDLLSQAVVAAEAVSGPKHVRVAPVLLVLAGLYARTARVTLAEGLYRSAAKLLHMDPLGEAHAPAAPLGSHASLGALLAWRFAQLLTALPRRESEAAAWSRAAEGLCQRGAGGWLDALDPGLHWHGLRQEEVWGGLQHLTGAQQPGRGFVADLMTRRAYVQLPLPA